MNGKWQREIISRAAGGGAFWLNDILPDDYTLAEYQGLHAAARTLADRGVVEMSRRKVSKASRCWVEPGKKKLEVKPPQFVYPRIRIHV